jgi:uncharacterized membrane protein
MSMAVVDQKAPPKRRNHSQELKELSDEAADIIRRHEAGEIDSDEAARCLNELKSRHRTFLDRLVG